MVRTKRTGEASMQMGSTKKRARRTNNNKNPSGSSSSSNGGGNMRRESAVKVWSPEHLVDTIISCLPVDRAARMSLVSTAFKNSWKQSCYLIFDETFIRNRQPVQVVAAIDKILEQHTGKGIKKFKLFIDPFDIRNKIYQWMDMLGKMEIAEINLDFPVNRCRLQLPNALLRSQSTKVLKLKRVFMFRNLPAQFSGMSNLTTLVLKNVDFLYYMNSLELIVAQSLSLELLELSQCRRIPFLRIMASKHERFRVLKIDNCWYLCQIDITAPSLGSFFYHGNALDIHFLGNHAKLDNVVTTFSRSEVLTKGFQSRCFMEDVRSVKILSINSAFLKGLCSKLTAVDLGFKLPNLTELQVNFDELSDADPYDVAVLAVHCPRLERLYIELDKYKYESGASWKLQLLDQHNYSFQHLKVLVVKGYKSEIPEADMLRYILMSTKSQVNVSLATPKNYSNSPTRYSLYELIFHLYPWKPTPQIRLKIYNHGKDKEAISPTHELKSWWWNMKKKID